MKPLTVQALEKIGKDWSKSSSDREARLQHTKDFAQFVADKFGLQNIQNLKPGHIEAYVKDMKEQGLANGTMCNRMVHVRELAEAIGKPNIVALENEAYGIERGESRSNPIIENQGLVSQVRSEIAARAAAGEPKYIMANASAELREAFPLRAKESLMSFKVVEINGIPHLRIEGAKGGRGRDLPINTPARAAAVATAQAASKALKSGTGRIIPPRMSLKQAYNSQRYTWSKHGGKRADFANMHASRHNGAQELHNNGATWGQVMVELGHSEPRSPSAYVPK